MSQIIYPITHLPPVIDIGKQTEKGVTRIGFDVHEWLDNWPGMRFSVQPTRPGETESYTAATDMVGSVIFWLVGAVDTEKPGSGTVEVLGVTEDERKLSFMCRTAIANTNTVTTAEIPEPNQPWVDQVILAGEGAKADAKAAEESAQEASQAAAEAGQYSANADAKAASAAQSAVSAGESASAAEQAKEKAIAQADDAEESAKNAQTWEGRAEAHARNAAASAISSADSAAASAQSASAAAADAAQVEATMNGLNEDFGNSSVFIVTAKNKSESFPIPYADRTQEEIRAAVAAGKTCILVHDAGEVYTYWDESTYENLSGEMEETIRFMGALNYNEDKKLWYRYAVHVRPDGQATWVGEPVRTATPRQLIIKGAVEARFDGSEYVTVEIPDVASKLFVAKFSYDSTAKGYVADKTAAEIRAAVEAGKACLLVDADFGTVQVYAGDTADGPKFVHLQDAPNDNFGPGLWLYGYIVTADGTLTGGVHTPAKTPNPLPLTITGAVEAEYDGSSAVTVNIPAGGGAGLPETTDPHMHLVTDANGKVTWEKRADIKVILPETEVATSNDSECIISESVLLEGGKTYIVTINGMAYDIGRTAKFSPAEGITCVAGGNLSVVGLEGGNPDCPFTITSAPGYGTSITFADPNIYPDTTIKVSIVEKGEAVSVGGSGGGVVYIHSQLDPNGSHTATSFELIPDKTYAECQELVNAGNYLVFVFGANDTAYMLPMLMGTSDRLCFGFSMVGSSMFVNLYPDNMSPVCVLEMTEVS